MAEISNREDSHLISLMNFKKSEEGVLAVSETTYTLNSLLDFLAHPKVNIPVKALDIGTITPVEIRKACKMTLGKRWFSTVIGFQVDITKEAFQLAEQLRVKIICDDILERLCQRFKDHVKELEQETEVDGEAPIFPCVLRILPNLVFNRDNPIVLGVLVINGFIKVGIPVCNPRSDCVDIIGRIAWIEKDDRSVQGASLGETVIIKIVPSTPEQEGGGFGSNFEFEDVLISRISRGSINALKAKHRDDLCMKEWRLVSDLKSVLNIK